MKLKLRIIPKETKEYTKPHYRFVVIDLDKSKQYPQNFVSILPKSIKEHHKLANNFERIFGKESKTIARQLLQKALRSRPDPDKAKAIRDRLKLLATKPAIKGKCQACGKIFDLDKRKFRKYKVCNECYRKR